MMFFFQDGTFLLCNSAKERNTKNLPFTYAIKQIDVKEILDVYLKQLGTAVLVIFKAWFWEISGLKSFLVV